MIFDGVDHQARQEEVIGHVTFPGERTVGVLGVAGVNLRQELEA